MMGPRPSTSIITSELLTDGIVEKVSATSAMEGEYTTHKTILRTRRLHVYKLTVAIVSAARHDVS